MVLHSAVGYLGSAGRPLTLDLRMDSRRNVCRVGAFEVGQLAEALYGGYMSHAGIGNLIAHPSGSAAIERLEAECQGPASAPIASVLRKDGTSIWYSLSHYLRQSTARRFSEMFERVWLGGALLTLGDALDAEGYFDKGPDLQVVRHLRNGIAHGNRFYFRNGEPRRPARFTGPQQRLMSDGVTSTPVGDAITFEITPGLHGQEVLFNFMGAGDVCDLLQFVGVRLTRMGNGDPPIELFRQA